MRTPRRCSIRVVLSFLQQVLECRLSPSTLKVYIAAISAHHDTIEGKSVGKQGSLPPTLLGLVLRAFQTAPFEPLQSIELEFLSMKSLLLNAFAMIKRVGDLPGVFFPVNESCLEFRPADYSATLRTRPGYVPNVPITPLRDQGVNLQALPLEEADPALGFLCPGRALRWLELRALGPQNSSLSVMEDSRRGRLSLSRGWPTG